MANRIRSEQRIFHDVEISAQQKLKGRLIQRLQPHPLLLQRLLRDEVGEEFLDLVQVADLEDVHIFGRGFQDARDRLIIEQQVNAVHALG